MNKKIIEKIKKLLSLSKSNNENEALSSMAKARELMAKYKIEISEVKDSNNKTKENIIKDNFGVTYNGRQSWKGSLSLIIADNFGCYCYIDVDKSIKILGKETDVKVVQQLILFGINIIEKESDKLVKEYRRQKKSIRGLTKEYGLGFVAGVKEKFKEQNKFNIEGCQLMIIKDKDVDKEFKALHTRKSRSKSKRYSEHEEVYNKGYKEGKQFSANGRLV